jgi:phosphomannomutase
MKNIFLAYDVRGIYGKEITKEVAERLGKSLGTLLKGRFAIGYDTRASSKVLHDCFVKGLISTGSDVVSIGLAPNPVLYFYCWKNKIPGVLVTASHLAREYNGFKFARPDGSSFSHELGELRRIFFSKRFARGKGKVEYETQAIDRYLDFIGKKVRVKRELRIAMDCFNGASSLAAPRAMELANCKPIELYTTPDQGLFSGRKPEPTEENLKELQAVVLEEGSHFGVAYDGDGDRSVFVDELGRTIRGDTLTAIFAREILSGRKGKVIAPVNSSSCVRIEVEKLGGELVECRIGHTFIEDALLKERALFAGEPSSHFYFNLIYPFSDGILATLKLAEILSKDKGRLSNLVDSIPRYPISSANVDCKTHEKKLAVIEILKEELGKRYESSLVDGIKVFLDEGWILLRPSNTEPLIRITVEARSKKEAKELLKEFSSLVRGKL